MAIDVKEATEAAVTFLKSVFPTAVGIDLEEVEIVDSPGGEQWHITLSFAKSDDQPKTIGDLAARASELFGGPVARSYLPKYYKSFTVDAPTGKVKSMKIRKV